MPHLDAMNQVLILYSFLAIWVSWGLLFSIVYLFRGWLCSLQAQLYGDLLTATRALRQRQAEEETERTPASQARCDLEEAKLEARRKLYEVLSHNDDRLDHVELAQAQECVDKVHSVRFESRNLSRACGILASRSYSRLTSTRRRLLFLRGIGSLVQELGQDTPSDTTGDELAAREE